MRYLFLILLVSNVHASFVSISESELFLTNGAYTSYAKKEVCEKEKGSECLAIESINPDIAEMVDNIVLDYITKEDEQICKKLTAPVILGDDGEVIQTKSDKPFNEYQDCDNKFIELTCENDSEKIKNYDLLQVYCAKPVMKVDGKKLINSEAKKAEHEAKKEAKKLLEIEKKEKRKADKLSIKEEIKTATTVAKLKAVVEKLIEAQE